MSFGHNTVVQLGQPPHRIDLLTAIDGVSFTTCWKQKQTMAIDGLALNFIGFEDFKLNKRAAGRLKDLADLESLEGPAGGSP